MSTIGTGSRRMLVLLGERGFELASALPPSAVPVSAGCVAVTLPGRRQHPWDEAHQLVDHPISGLESALVGAYAEPDFIQTFPFESPGNRGIESLATPPCTETGPNVFWPVGDPQFGWHLDDQHSGLKSARERVGSPTGRKIRIGILDTGYDPLHATKPQYLRSDLERNFFDEDTPNDATDPGRHSFGNQPGHGTATMALLAGNRVEIPLRHFNDFVGGAPHAEVVPIRIADSVVHIRTSAMASGLEYAVVADCNVVSISMGGIPSRAWAKAVNRAYEAGIAIFAAAGNRFGPSPPSSIIYPARFNRVTAVCGVTADRSPYYRSGLHSNMQGCFGPSSKMGTAIASFTPNAMWAMMGCANLVGFGGGTSSATPQVAAAAALWLQNATIPDSAEPWQRVEAVRWALFESADKEVADLSKYFGNGLLRANQALNIAFRADLPQAPTDEVSFPWLRLLGVLDAVGGPPISEKERMYEVEALQVFLQSPEFETLVDGADPERNLDLPLPNRINLITAMRASPRISEALRRHLDGILWALSPK